MTLPTRRPRLAHEAFLEPPDDRQVVPTVSNAVGTRCRASGATATRNRGIYMSQPCPEAAMRHCYGE